MNALKDAFVRAGFDAEAWEQVRDGSVEQKRREMQRQGLKPRVEPIKQVRVKGGIVRTSGGLQMIEEEYR